MHRVGLVVHPKRPIDGALETVREWSGRHGVDVVQVPAVGQERHIAPPGETADCDLLLGLGGDGTTLAALRAAMPAGKPVLGVACGSLGALTAVKAPDLGAALDRVHAGDWTARALPALAITGNSKHLGVNDLVIVRKGAGQVTADVEVDGELYIRIAGDGLVVATQVGSSAYTLAAGGPVLAPRALGMVVTPLAPHGGCAPPLVTAADSTLRITVDPGHGGARVEIDGQFEATLDPPAPHELEVRLEPDRATLVALGGEETMLAGLRRRRILMDSPRILARDDRNPVKRV